MGVRGIAATAIAAAAAVLLAPAALAHDGGKRLSTIGLADRGRTLVGFTTDEPGDTSPIGLVKGYLGDAFLVGIDFRPQSGSLFGVGNAGGVYRLDVGTAEATNVGRLTVPLEGMFFGVDFDPAANALRVVGDSGQNLRQPFGPADIPLGPTAVDTPLDRTGVSGVAYADGGADTGTLYGIDTLADQLVLLDPPADGTTAGIGAAGELGDLVGSAGFDIHTTLDQAGGAVDDDAFAVVLRTGVPVLLAIDLADGTAVDRGEFDIGVVDLAIRLDQEGTP